MSPLRKRRERRRERESAARRARREELSARLRGDEPEESAAAREQRRAERESARKAKAQKPAEAEGPAGEQKPRKRQPKQRVRRKARAARIEATRSSSALARRGKSRFDGARRAWRRGVRSTGARVKKAGPALGRGAGRARTLVAPLFTFAFGLLAGAYRLLRTGLVRLGRLIAGGVRRLDRLLTPARGALLVTVGAAACLVLSQFVDYRGVEIGQPGYGQVAAIASAPQVDLQKAGEAHSFLLIPLAAFAVVMAAVAAFAGRRRAADLVALAGLAGLAVTLLIDMPSGLDAGGAGVRFSGAHAVLREGFYAQLAACAGLVICGVALVLDLGAAGSGARKRARRSSRRDRARRSRKAPSLAESGT
jgi:hypothetical protein